MPKIFLHKNCQTGKLALGGLGEFSLPVRPRTCPGSGLRRLCRYASIAQSHHCAYLAGLTD